MLAREFEEAVKKQVGKDAAKVLAALPSFTGAYQPWVISEAKILIKSFYQIGWRTLCATTKNRSRERKFPTRAIG